PDGRILHLDERSDLRGLAEGRAGPDVRERADLDAGRDPDVAPDHGERWTVTSGSISTPASIQVEVGSTIVTPASICASLTRSRSAAATAASSTRVLIPSTSNGSSATCTATRSPSPTRRPIVSVT